MMATSLAAGRRAEESATESHGALSCMPYSGQLSRCRLCDGTLLLSHQYLHGEKLFRTAPSLLKTTLAFTEK